MRIKISCLFFFIGISFLSYGQDLIVTSKGDSLNVKISLIEQQGVYFTYRSEGKKYWSYASKDSLSYYTRGFYKISALTGRKVSSSRAVTKWRFGLDGGGSMQTGKYSANNYPYKESKNYLDKLRWGYTIGAQGDYFFSDMFGLGLKYNIFMASNSINNVFLNDSVYGNIEDRISVNFLGPEFTLKITPRKHKTSYLTTLAFGLLSYRNYSTKINSATINRTTFGVNLTFGPEFMVTDHFVLAPEASLVIGSVTGDLEGKHISEYTNMISLTRFDLTLAIRWYN